MNYLKEEEDELEEEEDFILFEEEEEFQMPWCVTCGYVDETHRLRKAGPIERRKAKDFPDHKFRLTMSWVHKRISFIQYLRCKWNGHDCYFW